MVVALTGLVLTATTARFAHVRGRAQRDAQLADAGAQLAFAVRERVRLPAEALQTLGAVIAHAPTIDRATFESVAASVHRRAPPIYALEWAPLVAHDQRAALEAQARAEGRPAFAIVEPGPDGMAPAAMRDRYLPILYIYPENPAIGFDVLWRAEAAAVFFAACASGAATFSPRYRLIEDTDADRASVILYEPVWRGGQVPADPEARCREVAGAAILIFRVQDMVGDAISHQRARWLDVALEDVSATPPALLYENRPGAAARATGGASRAVPLELYGRTWRLRVGWPAPPPWPWLTLLLGGALTALATAGTGGAVWYLTHHRRLRSMTKLGQYRVERELGRGAMGVVYQAEHTLLRRPAALKLLAPELSDAASRARFEREVRLAAKLQHPSIVQVYDFGVTAEGLFFYAMELLDGVTVRDLVADHGPVPPARAAALVRQIAEALREAHGKRIIHRDLAPANLMVTVRGETYDVVKVLDFGLVKRIRSLDDEELTRPRSEAGVVIGSPGFIAPEVLRGREADERVDIYAVGAIWYLLLAGRAPFSGPTPTVVMQSQLRAAPAPLHKLIPDLPAGLAELVADAMQPDPRLRLRSMSELLLRLDALELPAWTQEQARRWWKDHRRRT